MYKELEKWLLNINMSKAELARQTSIRYNTLLIKLNGKYKLTLSEAKEIKKVTNYKKESRHALFNISILRYIVMSISHQLHTESLRVVKNEKRYHNYKNYNVNPRISI